MTMTMAEPRTFHWTAEQYHALAAGGVFNGRRVQLIRGEIIEMPPMGHPHAKAISRVERILQAIFEPADSVGSQMPLNLSGDSEPEPDAAVVAGNMDRYTNHPTQAILVVEVADTSLVFDREKAELYAAAGIPEYWIVNLVDHQLEVHRDPVPAIDKAKACYRDVQTLAASELVAPIARPEAKIAVSGLFA
ncbi:MAG: Uma2 family endonuclease [Tepidisphaerales bacterium]